MQFRQIETDIQLVASPADGPGRQAGDKPPAPARHMKIGFRPERLDPFNAGSGRGCAHPGLRRWRREAQIFRTNAQSDGFAGIRL